LTSRTPALTLEQHTHPHHPSEEKPVSHVEYNLSKQDGRQTIAVFGSYGDESFRSIVTPANPSYERLVNYLLIENADTSDDALDAEYVHGLVDPAVGIGKMLAEEFEGRVTFDRHHFYLDGIPETSALSRVVRDKVLNGDTDWKRLVRFLVRLDNNPSKRAKDAIWEWVEKHGVSITEDGRIAGFKGLVNGTDAVTGEENVPVSYHSGPNNFIDGVLYGEPGVAYQVPHRVGTVISKRRADVDDNASLACSTGLHVGAYSYAKTFGENREDGTRYSTMGRMAASLPDSTFAIVVFAPEAVVSVPEDGTADWKIRVHEYEVSEFLDTVEDVLKDNPVYDVKTAAPFLPYGQEVSTDGVVERPEPEVEETTEQVVPTDVQWWEIYGTDNLGETIYETISGTEEDAQEVLEVHDPEGEFGYDYREADAPEEQPVLPLEEALEQAIAEEQDESILVDPEKGTGLLGRVVLRDYADANPALARDLEARLPNGEFMLGHKALARKYEAYTTEASVRRYRKNLEG
jgi:hypothetical protein